MSQTSLKTFRYTMKSKALAIVLALCALNHVLATPVYVMLPLDSVTNSGDIKDANALENQLKQLKDAGVDGVMTDVWWGIVESGGPKEYKFDAYSVIVGLCEKYGLRLQAVMSFHQCGGNVGDTCDIKLPSWVLSVANDYLYKDREGSTSPEYLSLFADNESIQGRTPVEIYADFVGAFADTFRDSMASTIVTLQIGLGPAGELRYPSYPLSKWQFPGVGEFQCYDKLALESLKKAASDAGHPEWGTAGPSNAGTYSSRPDDTGFFNQDGSDNFSSDYGKFFIGWYSQALVDHGDRVLSAVKSKLSNVNGVSLAAKVSGIHWLYKNPSHAAELTAGYNNANGNDAYAQIAKMLKKNNVELDFTCLEMKDEEQSNCDCAPEELVNQVKSATVQADIAMSGENALPRYDEGAFDQIVNQSGSQGRPLSAFTYLRLCQDLLNNLNTFSNFVQKMHNVNNVMRLVKLLRGIFQ